MLNWILRTDDTVSLTLQRLLLGIVFLPHGAQKMLGVWGGAGFQGTVDAFTQTGVPTYLAVAVILTEFFGAIGLILGFLTRICALGIGIIMVGAIATVHWQYGFFMNWYGTQSGEGFEFHLLAIAVCIGLLVRGAGLWSIDRYLSK